MRTLDKNSILKDQSDDFNLCLYTGKQVQIPKTRNNIHMKGSMGEYPKYKFDYHTVSNFVKVVSNDVKEKYNTTYVDFYETNKDLAHDLSLKF